MRSLRPECETADGDAIPNDTALFLIQRSVAKRRQLVHGRLDAEDGAHCALGAFWEDNPKAIIYSKLIEEVAAVNDSMPNASRKERWKMVNSWLRFKIAALTKRKRK